MAIGTAFPGFAFLALGPEDGIRIVSLTIFEYSHSFLEIFFSELATVIYDEEDPIAASRKQVMLKWGWSEIGIYNMTGLSVNFSNPLSELKSIWDSCRQENIVDFIREENDSFFPYNPTFYYKRL